MEYRIFLILLFNLFIMKKISFLLFLIVLGIQSVNSQVVFSESFTSGMPSNFVLVNNDGKTPASSVSYVNNAWVVRNESTSNSNKVAVSTSWYNPAGASDDWMITPQITVGNNNMLKWRARALDSSYPDGYQVLLSPTGDTALSSFNVTLFSTNAENSQWTTRGVSLVPYNGQTVRIAFRNNSNDKFLLQVDDIEVSVAPVYDAGITEIRNYRYYQQGSIVLAGTIKNYGLDTINSIDVHWTYDGNTVNTQSLTGLNVASYGIHNFNHSVPLAASGSNKYPIRMWTSNINGNADANPTNDTTAVFAIYSVSAKPAKKTLLEEATGAWCQFCPDGAVKLLQVLNSNPNVIGYAVHDYDAMSNDQTDSVNVYASGFPTGYIDRFKFLNLSGVDVSRTQWSIYASIRNNLAVPFGLSMTHSYDAWTRTVTVELTADSKINTNDRDYRFGIVVVQDSMSGTGQGWDQANFYNSQSGHPYYQAGNPIVGYQHRHVARWWPLGVWGANGSIPQMVTDGATYNQSYTFTLPQDYDENRISIVGLVQEFTNDLNERPVLNVISQKLDLTTTSISSSNSIQGLEIYPNPATNFTTISFNLPSKDVVNIQILDITGKTVYKESIEFYQGVQELDINTSNFSNGTYVVNITTSNNSLSKKLVINR